VVEMPHRGIRAQVSPSNENANHASQAARETLYEPRTN